MSFLTPLCAMHCTGAMQEVQYKQQLQPATRSQNHAASRCSTLTTGTMPGPMGMPPGPTIIPGAIGMPGNICPRQGAKHSKSTG